MKSNIQGRSGEAASVQTLLRPDGMDFLRGAYRTLLGRDPDTQGQAHYLAEMERGVSKSEILARLCGGEEYRTKGREVPGLSHHLRRQRVRRWLVQRLFGDAAPSRSLQTAPLDLTAPTPSAQSTSALSELPLSAWLERMDMLERLVGDLRGDTANQHVLRLFESFRPDRYLELNPDVASSGMNPYEHWVLAGHRERRRWGHQAVTASTSAVPAQLPLRSPNGQWEWEDYPRLRDDISSARAQRRQGFKPQPAQLIHVDDSSVQDAIATLRLPAPPANPEVSIIIPVFNHLALTVECLRSIAANTSSGVSYEIILADDCSEPEVAAGLKRVPNARYMRNESNQGFLRNCNNAAKLARGRWVLFLNNDVQVPAGWLQSLKDAFLLSPRVGIVGSAFVYPSGHLQEAGGAFRVNGTALMVGLNEDPQLPAYAYPRRVEYVSGACLMISRALLTQLGGFSEAFLPCYCEDSDLCLRAQEAGYEVWVEPRVHVVHHLSRTTGAIEGDFKLRAATRNMATLAGRHADVLSTRLPRILAFYLPQFHPFAENNLWWGEGFTEWTNVSKARPNFVGHDQPRLPADLGYYDLRLNEVMRKQAELAKRYGIDGFVFYYYWFGGKRVLEAPIEQMLSTGSPDMPFCLCWANENWTRRWDGRDRDLLMSQSHSPEDDLQVIADLARYLKDPRNIRVDGKPLLLIYRVTLFPDFAATARRWRTWCRDNGVGEIYLAMVESFELVHSSTHPSKFGCDAAVEFPPQGLAEMKPPEAPLLNPDFQGSVADFKKLATAYATRDQPAYARFKGVMPGWDNTARRQNEGLAFQGSTPGAFQAWLEDALEETIKHRFGDERLVFVNAWNEWAEGAYLEPDRRFGHDFLQAVRNARDASVLRSNAPSL